LTKLLQYDRITHYLKGTLSVEDRMIFEREIELDPALAELVKKHRIAHQALLASRLLKLKTQMQSDIASGLADQTIKKYRIKRALRFGLILLATSLSIYLIVTVLNKKDVAVKSRLDKNTKDTTPSLNAPLTSSLEEKITYSRTTKAKANSMVIEEIKDTIVHDRITVLDKHASTQVLQETPTEKQNVVLEKKDPCANVSFQIKGTSTATCKGKKEGVIDASIKGGTPPYQCGLQKKGLREINWNKAGSSFFTGLEANTYHIVIKDHIGCTQVVEKPFHVEEKNCGPSAITEYAVRPEYQERVEIPIEADGEVIIYNRSGQEVLKAPVYEGRDFIWDGTAVEKGLYLFVLEYANGIKTKGYITVY
jgi:hypothetical protein